MGKHGEKQKCSCALCGKEFLLPPSMILKKNYCSYEHRIAEKVSCTCVICGKEVLKGPTQARQKFYCSPECKRASRLCHCDYCGKEMLITPSRKNMVNYCSEECKERAGYNCRCDYCGKEYKSRWVNQTFNYCSEKCKEEANLNCVCEYCGKRFHRAENHVKKHMFCSNECYLNSVQNYEIKICPYCHKEFREDRARHKFCSNRCSGKYYGEIKSEKTRPRREAEQKKKEMISELKQGIKELKARIKEIKRYKECKWCGKIFRSERGNSFCSKECRRKSENRSHDRRLKRNGKMDYSINLHKLYKRDKGICKLCGKPVFYVEDIQSDEYPSIDHIIPISKGGLHQWDNVQLAHRGCNTEKGDELPPTVKNA